MRQRLRQQLYLDHSPSLLLRRMGKWMRFRLLTEPASQETAGRLTAALSVRSLCIFFFLRPVFLFSPLALLIDLVDSISIYDKSSHVLSSLGCNPFPYILFPCPLFRAFTHESAGPLIYCHMQEVPI